MFAARREHVEQVIRPALARGDWVRVRPLHRRDVRVPGRRPRRAARAHRRARAISSTPIANPTSRSCSTCRSQCRAQRLQRAEAAGRTLDKFERETAGVLRARARCLSRARRRRARSAFAWSTASRPVRGRARGTRDGCWRRCERWPMTTHLVRRPRGRSCLPWQADAARAALARSRDAGRTRCCSRGPRGIGKRTLALQLRASAVVRDAARRTASRAARARAAGTSPRASIRICSCVEPFDDRRRRRRRSRSMPSRSTASAR